MSARYRPVGLAVAIACLVLFVGALGVRLWASGHAVKMVGPDHVAAGAGRVYVHVDGELYVLSESGAVQARHSLAPLMARDQLIDLRVLRDGSLLLARRRPAGFYACTPAPWSCEEMRLPVAEKLRDQFEVFPTKTAGGS